MSYKRIIPCLDVNAGRVVKGVNFVGLRDAGDPVEIALRYQEQGADELTLLDITATTEGRELIFPIVEAVARQLTIPLTVGGGVRSVADVQRLLDAGASKAGINSAAITRPELVDEVVAACGPQVVVLAIDARQRSAEDAQRLTAGGQPVGPGWDVYSHGGGKNTGLDAVAWALEVVRRGAAEILLTSMDRDGTKNGFDLDLTRAVAEASGVPVIASGGVGSLEHLAEGLEQGCADAVLAASIFHFGQHTVAEAKQFLRARGIEVRL